MSCISIIVIALLSSMVILAVAGLVYSLGHTGGYYDALEQYDIDIEEER